MLYESVAGISMDVKFSALLGSAAFFAVLALSRPGADAASVIEGRRCFGSELAINNNLPLNARADETDIARIEGIFVPAVHRVVGWLYTTRNGSTFIQVGSKNDLGHTFRSVGDADLAAVVEKSQPFAYYELPAALSRTIRTRPSIVLASCYGTGK